MRWSCVFLLSSCSVRGWRLLGLLLGFASVPLHAVLAPFRGVSRRELPFGGSATFLAPYACPTPAVELCLWGLRCLSCGACFQPCAMLFLRRLRFCASPSNAGYTSGFLHLFYLCLLAPLLRWGVGWAAALPLCSKCFSFSFSGWLADDRWFRHPVTGFSHWHWDCSLYDSVVVLYDSPCLSALFVVLSSRSAVLSLCGYCALFSFWLPLLQGGWCASGLRCLGHTFAAKFVQSQLPSVVGPPSAVPACPPPALAGLVVWSQSFGPSGCSCGLSSGRVSAAAFCPLGLLSHPLLLFFLAWVSSFGVCSGLGWKVAVLSWILPSFGRGFPSLVLVGFRWAVPTVLLSRLLEFLELFSGVSFLSLPVFAASSGWLADSP